MRPAIEGVLEERCQTVSEQYGYASPSEFVRDAVRRRCEELENATTLGEYAPSLSEEDVGAMLVAIDAARDLDPGDSA
jgi:metal-responsive CopG/Arc/MetJ family transcriptional regulator